MTRSCGAGAALRAVKSTQSARHCKALVVDLIGISLEISGGLCDVPPHEAEPSCSRPRCRRAVAPGVRAVAQTSSSSSTTSSNRTTANPNPSPTSQPKAQPSQGRLRAAVTITPAAPAAAVPASDNRTSPLRRRPPRWASRSPTPASTLACCAPEFEQPAVRTRPDVEADLLASDRFMFGGTLFQVLRVLLRYGLSERV